MTNGYEYQPLSQSTKDIRLLRFLPRNGNDKLKYIPACGIRHTSLRKDPKFVALSYVWGDAKHERMILLENHPVRVTKNLYDAMMALRPLEEPIIIWIDSLCINQLDTEEKSWQVGLMGDIYRQAQRVIAWLGLANDSSDSVMDYLNEFGERADACGLAMGPEICLKLWHAMVSDPSVMQRIPAFVYLPHTPSDGNKVSKYAIRNLLHSIDGWHDRDKLLPIAELQPLFRRPWWGRIWVLQEIALSQHAEFVCGTRRISRSRFAAAFNAFYALSEVIALQQSRQRRDLTNYHTEVLSTVSHRPKLMLSIWRIHAFSAFPLLALLRATTIGSIHLLGPDGYQHLESTDPRDKIFALLGLTNDRKDLERLGVVPDYKKSKEEVFASVTVALLQQGHISILSLCRAPEVPLVLPSWVPDWSRPMPKPLQDVESDHMTLTPKFNASGVGTHPSSITILRRGEAIKGISVECYVYDKIYEPGEVPRVPATGTCVCEFDWLYEILRLTYKRTSVYVNFYRRLRAVVRTSFGDITFGHDELLERAKDDCLDARCLEALHILQQRIHRITQRDIRSELRKHFTRKQAAKRIQSEAGKLVGLQMNCVRMSPGNSPFVTEKGHPGLSSRHIKQGDIIALIQGAQVPFVLRYHSNGKYTIISEAYVDGIMDGEAAENAVWQKLEFV
jgi:hypothetical protein